MAVVANIDFVDVDSGNEGLAIVRVEDNAVGLALSLKSNGDIEVFLDEPKLEALVQALSRAHSMMPDARSKQ